MRILFISNLFPNPLFPNMATYNRQQIRALGELCDVDVISPIPWTACLKQKRPDASRTEDGVTIHHPLYYYTPRIFRAQYGRFFHHSIKVAATRLLARKKYDLIYSSWLYPDAWAAARLAEKYRLPLFVKVHGSDVNLLQPGSTITRQAMAVIEQTRKVICVSRALKNRLIELGAPEDKLEVLYNGVDRSIFHPMDRQEVRRVLGIPPDDFVVLFVGNLKKNKGLDELVAAFKTFQDNAAGKPAHLVIIGAGPHGAQSQQQVAELGLGDEVNFLGSQPLATIAKWMNAASVHCLPSYMEGVPNVVLEALACETSVIATNVGGIPELDQGLGNMLLVEPRSAGDLAAALFELYRHPPTPAPSTFICSWQENATTLMKLMLQERTSQNYGGEPCCLKT